MKEIKMERSITTRGQDSLQRYLKDVSGYPLLSADEEIALARKIKNGDHAALHQLINCNLRFVVSVAKKYEMQGLPLADLIEEGNIGLMKAAERFDESRGFKFISYAVWWIRQSILEGISTHKRLIRLPLSQINGVHGLEKAAQILEQQLERRPVKDELIEFMDISEGMAHDYLQSTVCGCWLDQPYEPENGELLYVTLKDPGLPEPDVELGKAGLKSDIELMLKALSPRQQRVLSLAFGLGNDFQLMNDDIGSLLGLSTETIRRAKKKALTQLREIKKIQMMREYL
ncbi:RNA polymerase primary sigma factor [Pedobacter africanus]|uniref:RNA polymerase primary sigma factor n=1 Tax=Pedobacter africanus TaxID=151894 RepID=A0ACC6KUY6_9SPHI|nr:RNA polymerase sigma factor RpoD/SigA [Pedobacter africanus]MDR6783042.1 RNA polymerase primary sigma factor [Pedobacter africanus]